MTTCSVSELKSRLERENPVVLDVRELPEWVEGHVEGSRLAPLSELRKDAALAGEGGEVLLLCRSGRRAQEAAALLGERGFRPVVVEGGVDAWRAAGYPTQREKGPISLERQVRIAAGALVLLGLLVPGAKGLSMFVGAGLVFAGVTNTCGMGLLLARLPWNRPRREAAACPAGH